MKNRLLVSTVVAAALFSTSQALLAAPSASLRIPVQAKFGKTKMIKFNVRNDSAAAVTFKAGDQQMTVGAGKSIALKLPEGTALVAQETTPTFTSGSVLATVSPVISGATIVIR